MQEKYVDLAGGLYAKAAALVGSDGTPVDAAHPLPVVLETQPTIDIGKVELLGDDGAAIAGTKADAAATATDTTPVTWTSIFKQISKSVQAMVLGAGSAIIGKVGIDQTTPGTTNGVSLVAGTNSDVGKTNIRHFNVAGSTLTRPANTTAYSANDSISDNATAGSVTANTVTVSDTNDDPVDITEILLDTTDTGFGGVLVRCHVFNSDPTANSGVGAGDNAAFSNKKAGWLGTFTGTMQAFSDGAKATLTSDGSPVRIANVESGGKRLWWQLQVLGAATPSANSTTFIPRFKGYQGRV